MLGVEDILHTLRTHKDELFIDYPIKSLAVFGSYVRNEQSGESDVDILVEFKDKIGVEFIDLADELERILGSKVDLVSKKGIQEKYLKSISSDLMYV